MQTALQTFEDWLLECLTAAGVYPMPGVLRLHTGEMEFTLFDVGPQKMLKYVAAQCRAGRVAEFVVGLDSYTQPNQGTTLDSAVIIFHITPDAARVGVWEYELRADNSPETRPTVWDNPFWTNTYAELARDMQNWLR